MTEVIPYRLSEHSGNKPVILFLHGFLGSGEDWRSIANELADEFRTLVVDLPGHGRNIPATESEYTMPHTAASIADLLDHLHFRHTHIIGYSMGGRLGLYFAVTYPRLCDSVMVESSSPGLKTDSERKERVVRDNQLAEQIRQVGIGRFVEKWYEQPMFDSLRRFPERLGEIVRKRKSNHPEGLVRSLRGMGTGVQPPLWDNLGDLNLPLLLIAGEHDQKFRRIASEMADLCRHAEVRIIADAGHNVHVEQTGLYLEAVRTFLRKE